METLGVADPASFSGRSDKELAHVMIKSLSPQKLAALVQFLGVYIDPAHRPIELAPIDDEPVTDEQRRDYDEQLQWFETNEGIPMNEVMAELERQDQELALPRKSA